MRSLSVDDRDALERAFRRLTVEQRAVFVLHHHVGLPAHRDRRDARHPGRHGPLTTPLRDAGPAGGRRGRRGTGRPRRTDGMTSERDFDRLAQAWLELGPDEAPDRAVAAVLQAAETTPQVRRRPLATREGRQDDSTSCPGHRRGDHRGRHRRLLINAHLAALADHRLAVSIPRRLRPTTGTPILPLDGQPVPGSSDGRHDHQLHRQQPLLIRPIGRQRELEFGRVSVGEVPAGDDRAARARRGMVGIPGRSLRAAGS